jgi:hypothetical protein
MNYKGISWNEHNHTLTSKLFWLLKPCHDRPSHSQKEELIASLKRGVGGSYSSYSIILAMDFELKGISFPQGVEGEVI